MLKLQLRNELIFNHRNIHYIPPSSVSTSISVFLFVALLPLVLTKFSFFKQIMHILENTYRDLESSIDMAALEDRRRLFLVG